MKVYAWSDSTGMKWIDSYLLEHFKKGGKFTPMVLKWAAKYPVCPISFRQ